ncbi:hypothetical protein Afil01_14280 [Actinorhabdospora filicis]|uniref:Uncharacterized protein n=1 Tax=Actinorhabdospora filicis TaxID=1785913 RepID=A0A9W6SJ94_9ACTN|nr:hypothetical protein [Actinorhabdospora filicis]GLZ76621.1 hypothetical protein Afil01_14280 [Actinorhabdospora filicis]
MPMRLISVVVDTPEWQPCPSSLRRHLVAGPGDLLEHVEVEAEDRTTTFRLCVLGPLRHAVGTATRLAFESVTGASGGGAYSLREVRVG